MKAASLSDVEIEVSRAVLWPLKKKGLLTSKESQYLIALMMYTRLYGVDHGTYIAEAGCKRTRHRRILLLTSPQCNHCGEKRVEKLTVDHMVALCDGGSDSIENKQVLCARCHKRKTHRDNVVRRMVEEVDPIRREVLAVRLGEVRGSDHPWVGEKFLRGLYI